MQREPAFAHWLKQRRKALDLTQHELARLVGCAVVTIQKIEEGQRRPSKQVAERLAQQLAIPPEERDAFLRAARRADPPVQPTRAQQDTETLISLPTPLTALIGRAAEVAAVWSLLERPAVRLVTLTGPPGVGKTRLSIQVASELRDQFVDGVFFVALAPLTDPLLVLPTLAHVLGVPEAGGKPVLVQLQAVLRPQQVLLILDNFEHVVEAAPLITALLTACPNVHVLVTSRVPLRLYGEHPYHVEPLALPRDIPRSTVTGLLAHDAIRLFVARVQTFKPEWTLTASNAQAVSDICARLDGIPLALELAAARLRQFTPEALLDRLNSTESDPFRLLNGGPRDMPARQKTLHNAIAWSYNLLDAAQQQLFRRMGIFVGGCTAAAALAVCEASADDLTALIEQSLVQHELAAQPEARFTLLEMIREYALRALGEHAERALIEQAHAAYYLQRAEDSQEEAAWLLRMEPDHPNLRAALHWALEHDPAATGLRLCTALWWFWEARGSFHEGRRWTETMLAAAGNAAPHLRMHALRTIGEFAWKQGDAAQVTAVLTEALMLSRALGDHGMTVQCLMLLGMTASNQGNYAEATALLGQGLELARALPDLHPGLLVSLGELALRQEDYPQVQQLVEEGLRVCREQGDTFHTAIIYRLQGETALRQGDCAGARRLLEQSLRLAWEIGHPRVLAFALMAFAATFGCPPRTSTPNLQRAARIWGTAEVLREEVGIGLPVDFRVRYEHNVAAMRGKLAPSVWDVAWTEGRALSLEQAIAYALDEG